MDITTVLGRCPSPSLARDAETGRFPPHPLLSAGDYFSIPVIAILGLFFADFSVMKMSVSRALPIWQKKQRGGSGLPRAQCSSRPGAVTGVMSGAKPRVCAPTLHQLPDLVDMPAFRLFFSSNFIEEDPACFASYSAWRWEGSNCLAAPAGRRWCLVDLVVWRRTGNAGFGSR